MSCLFGKLLEGLPPAVVLIPVVFTIAEAMESTPFTSTLCKPRPSASACSCRRWASDY